MFLKPNVTRRAASRYGFEFEYRSKPSWDIYACLLAFAEQVRKDQRALQPKDMIDMQSFIWVQGSDEVPPDIVAGVRKDGRDDNILVDYLRNNRTNASVCAYSARARGSATVSMPVRWTELTPALKPSAFTVLTVPEYLKRRVARGATTGGRNSA